MNRIRWYKTDDDIIKDTSFVVKNQSWETPFLWDESERAYTQAQYMGNKAPWG